ncbi:MAG: peptidase S41 [Cyanobacteria bacterium QH_8_48_120]|nr:MAG: peptidase S41 [Cyanobacteria bacterium QH_10_48_56]PSO57361.1 MAG: peptidase S41 [Cyanobacteria bacterium QH_7_48_89]PSO57912.1 MAG: peptidase S41 [Cyanobacteria bacterium QH_1_48_107]PSO69082.1 MAG: peptidase S41 [Cyanobacteria bacterium QH_6_48_35]PSO77881.1 MAG: peptidase S41 [Cyanobacteria bacterium QH_8_48_120]PSO78653.1 MAG: peptidase S41 [Cyanobacteria bacterium QH_3_48_40]PSO96577.1 MAG: peptidase S41 [Cyanobacteria bacterium QS_9_48_30]PSO96831.1 MAG: peptidase S41 [Cyanobac
MNQPLNLRFSLPSLFWRGTIATLTTGSLLAPGLTPAAKATLEESPKAVIDEVWQLVNQKYAGKNFNQNEWQATRQELLSKDYASREQAYSAIEQALEELGDPYTRFLDPEAFKNLSNQTSGELSGIGARLKIDQKNKLLTVVSPLENSPASKAGIKAGDRILAINGQLTSLMSLEQATEILRGKSGTDVNLRLSRPGKGKFNVTLTRAQIEVPALSYSLKKENQKRVGYIQLKEFSSHAAEQMKQAIQNLKQKNADAFVLDLRDNPGGLLLSGVEIARMWMENGKIVSIVNREGSDRQFSANNKALTELPLAVLIDGQSASASEILAGALKDSGRAQVVGTRTYGKGTVQSVNSLSDGSGLAVTIARFYSPNGTPINQRGIKPDVAVDLSTAKRQRLKANPSLLGTENDPQYERAVRVLK